MGALLACVCVCTTSCQRRPEKDVRVPGTAVPDGYELPREGLAQNLGPLQGQ